MMKKHHENVIWYTLYYILMPKCALIHNIGIMSSRSSICRPFRATRPVWENEKLCGNSTSGGRSVFTQFRVFQISTSVDITVYQYRKNVLYIFIIDSTKKYKGRNSPPCWYWVMLTRLLANQRSKFTNAIIIITSNIGYITHYEY
jgi:hypothetical protein